MEETKPKGFDLTVHHRDPKTGALVNVTPYILRVCGETGSSEKTYLWERPKGSGNLFDKQGNPVGRWVMEEQDVKGKKIKVGKHDPKAEHIAFTPPPTKDQQLAASIAQKDVRIAELERELKAIQAESAPKAPAVTPTTKNTKTQGA